MLDSMYRQAAVFLEYVQHFIAYERHSNLVFARPGLPETARVKGVEVVHASGTGHGWGRCSV